MEKILSQMLTDAKARKNLDVKKVVMQSTDEMQPWKD